MEKRKLGNSGLEAAPLAFGGNVFGWTADEPTSFLLLDAFVDAGLDLIDLWTTGVPTVRSRMMGWCWVPTATAFSIIRRR